MPRHTRTERQRARDNEQHHAAQKEADRINASLREQPESVENEDD